MKTFKLTLTEDELIALIGYHTKKHSSFCYGSDVNPSVETSERIHTLTKRLNKDTPEVEEIPQVVAAKTEQQTSW